MDAKQKAEKIIELAKGIAEMDKARSAALHAMTLLLNDGEKPAAQPAAPQETPKAKRGRPVGSKNRRKRSWHTNDKFPVPEGTTREQMLHGWLVQHGPATYGLILAAKLMPQGSIHYYLRKLINAGQVTFDGLKYATITTTEVK